MIIHDISWPISPTMTTYKNKGGIEFTPLKQFEHDQVRETKITCTSHTGTHIDAPSHFLKDGSTIDQIALESLIGECAVIDLSQCAQKITVEDLQPYQAIMRNNRVLFKTRNSDRRHDEPFDPNFIYLDADAAAWCVEQHVIVIGIDYLGIERNQPAHETHIALLKAGITVIEGLRLAQISAAGKYELVCLPLLCVDLDGAPARAMLIER